MLSRLFQFLRTSSSYQNLDAAAFREAITTGQGTVLDVRTPAEFADGSLPGARNLDYLSGGLRKVLPNLDRSQAYYVFCRSGARSAQACRQMTDAGFARVFNLRGGISSYR